MKRIYHLLLLTLIVNVSAFAADFKVGEFKYEVLKDGTVEIKDAKKATGAYTIDSTITDPKSGKSYQVSSIGENAFKKSAITSITMPKTVNAIGKDAFKECKNLSSVNLSKNIHVIPPCCFEGCNSLSSINLDYVTNIGYFAFYETDLSEVVIPTSVSEIERKAFLNCRKLKSVEIKESNRPLKIGTAAFFGSPLEQVFIGRNIEDIDDNDLADKPEYTNNTAEKTHLIIGYENNGNLSNKFLRNIPNVSSVIFVDQNASDQALNLFSSIIGKEIPISIGKSYFIIKDRNYTHWEVGWKERSFKECVESMFSRRSYNSQLPKDYNIFFGATNDEDGKLSIIQEKPFDLWKGIETAYDNQEREKFLSKWAEYVRVAVEEPDKLPRELNSIKPEELMKFKDIFKSGITVLLDSVYLVKPSLTEAEIFNISVFINDEFQSIGHDYGIPSLKLENWAKKDILNKDLQSGAHKEDYERILKSIDRYYTFQKPSEDPYHQAMQLAALCGLGRWKEAATYFPKVHRAVTENGKYYQLELPYEITYMQKAINDHGYKAVAPNYNKTTSKKSGVKSSDDGSLTQFFMEAAINAGIEHYKAKKRKKAAQELFYESMGLDKKGRPKKK